MEIEPEALIVTTPVLPERVIFVPARRDVTPELVKAPEIFERPVPIKLLNDKPLRIKFVVDAVVNDASVVVEFVNCCNCDHEFAVVVPNARERMFDVFCSGYVNVRADCFVLNVLQSVDESNPSDSDDAIGMFSV